MSRNALPCPFYALPCEYVPMAHEAVRLRAEIERLRAALTEVKKIADDDGVEANNLICIGFVTREALEAKDE